MYWLAIGWEFTGIFLGTILIGWVVDSIFETQPWGIVLFMVLGVIGGFLQVFTVIKRWIEHENGNKRS